MGESSRGSCCDHAHVDEHALELEALHRRLRRSYEFTLAKLTRLRLPPATLHRRPFSPDEQARNAVDALATLGDSAFQLRRCREHGVDVSADEDRLGAFRRDLEALCTEEGDRVRGLVVRGAERCYESFRAGLAELRPGEGAFLFEWEVFFSREQVEYAATTVDALGIGIDLSPHLARFRAHDEELRRKLPTAMSELRRLGGTIDPPDLFPEAFWWRRLAWDLLRAGPGALEVRAAQGR